MYTDNLTGWLRLQVNNNCNYTGGSRHLSMGPHQCTHSARGGPINYFSQ